MRLGRRQRRWLRIMMQSYKDNGKRDVVIVTCFAANEPRAEYVRDFFQKKGKSTIIISTDFIHRGKYFREDTPEGYDFIKTQPYKKNLSITRLHSHHVFAKKAMGLVKEYEPKLLYVMIPANSLAKFAVKYKNKNNCKLVLDVIDLWPESLPISLKKNIWPLSKWSSLRDKNLKFSDAIITECELYQKKLQLDKLKVPAHTVYWPQKDYGDVSKVPLESDILRFLYLGSINNIIDIDGIVQFLYQVQKNHPVELHIIGDGEKREQLLNLLNEKKIPVEFYGYLYDHTQVYKIASCCHMGINLMKSTVHIGLTMKSVSYFEMGLPVVNNLKGDTWEFIEEYQAGINLTNYNMDSWRSNKQQLLCMGQQARKMFEELFSRIAFENQLILAIKNSLGDF